MRFEAHYNDTLVGLIALYLDNENNTAFITNVSVYPKFIGTGIGYTLLTNCKMYIKRKKINKLSLAVRNNNSLAINFYK